MSRLRVAVIGAGHLGRIHTRLVRSLEHVELVGIVDPDRDVRTQVAEEFRTDGFCHHAELYGRIDAAILAATTEHHHELGVDLLEHNVDLFVEKPLASSLPQAEEMVDVAQSCGRVLQVGHVERYNAAWQAVLPFVRRPRYIEAVRTSGYTFRSTDIGAVLDLMIHDLDLVMSVVRSEVVEVDAIGSTVFGPHEDMAHAHLRFANGSIANLNTSRTSFRAQRTMQIVSERAYASVDFGAPGAKIVRPSKRVLRGEIDVPSLSRSEREQLRNNLFTDLLPVRDLPLEPVNAILEEQKEFIDCVMQRTKPRVGGADALRCLSVAARILTQIKQPTQTMPRIRKAG